MVTADLDAALARIAVLEEQGSSQSPPTPCKGTGSGIPVENTPHSLASPDARSLQDVQGGTTGSAGLSCTAADHPNQADVSGQTSSSGSHTSGLHGAGAASQPPSSGAAVPAEVPSCSLLPSSSAAATASNEDGVSDQPSCPDEAGPLSAHAPCHFPVPDVAVADVDVAVAAGVASNSADSFDQPKAVQQGSWASATRAAEHRTAADSPAPAWAAVQELLLPHAAAADSSVDSDASVPASTSDCLAQSGDSAAAADSSVDDDASVPASSSDYLAQSGDIAAAADSSVDDDASMPASFSDCLAQSGDSATAADSSVDDDASVPASFSDCLAQSRVSAAAADSSVDDDASMPASFSDCLAQCGDSAAAADSSVDDDASVPASFSDCLAQSGDSAVAADSSVDDDASVLASSSDCLAQSGSATEQQCWHTGDVWSCTICG